MTRFVLAVCFSLLAACASTPSEDAPPGVEQIQFSALVADPALYDGKRVRVAGWVTLEPESYNLWESPGFQDGFDTDHCISLQNYERFWSKESKFNRRWVVASGVFYADATGGRPMVRLNACSKLALALDEGREFEFARKRRGRE